MNLNKLLVFPHTPCLWFLLRVSYWWETGGSKGLGLNSVLTVQSLFSEVMCLDTVKYRRWRENSCFFIFKTCHNQNFIEQQMLDDWMFIAFHEHSDVWPSCCETTKFIYTNLPNGCFVGSQCLCFLLFFIQIKKKKKTESLFN